MAEKLFHRLHPFPSLLSPGALSPTKSIGARFPLPAHARNFCTAINKPRGLYYYNGGRSATAVAAASLYLCSGEKFLMFPPWLGRRRVRGTREAGKRDRWSYHDCCVYAAATAAAIIGTCARMRRIN